MGIKSCLSHPVLKVKKGDRTGWFFPLVSPHSAIVGRSVFVIGGRTPSLVAGLRGRGAPPVFPLSSSPRTEDVKAFLFGLQTLDLPTPFRGLVFEGEDFFLQGRKDLSHRPVDLGLDGPNEGRELGGRRRGGGGLIFEDFPLTQIFVDGGGAPGSEPFPQGGEGGFCPSCTSWSAQRKICSGVKALVAMRTSFDGGAAFYLSYGKRKIR